MRKTPFIAMFLCLALAASFPAGLALAEEGSEAEPMAQEAVAPFEVGRLLTATGVQDREPVGVASEFPAGTYEVYCFLEATDIMEETEATFVWYHEGVEKARVSLRLGEGPRWRTWSTKDVEGQAGQWKVEVEDPSGETVASVEFTVM